ncbi:MAG: hypothetical protein XD36_2908 [Halomonas sp. 54_146]|nr:MAG: hypothetical protein XD36_2908 [Halomonas sp. 54_146]
MTVYPWQHPASRHKPCIQAKIVLMKCQESLVMIFPLAPGQCCKWPSEMTHQSVFVGTGSVACEVSFSSVVGVITISCRPSPSVWRRCSRRSAGPCDRSERQLRCLDDQGETMLDTSRERLLMAHQKPPQCHEGGGSKKLLLKPMGKAIEILVRHSDRWSGARYQD